MGNDKTAIAGVNVPSGFVYSDEAGNDLLGIENSTFGSSVTFDLGNGNDTLLANGNVFASVERIGGAGRDTLFLTGETVSGSNLTSEFERFPANVSALVQKLTDVFPFFV